MIEKLEQRRLMSVSVYYEVPTRTILLVGTPGNDSIFFNTGPNTDMVQVFPNYGGGTNYGNYFNLKPTDNDYDVTFTHIEVDMRGGNDKILVAGTISTPATLKGGDGNDVITIAGGTPGVITALEGGQGDDVLYGGTGSEHFFGGEGHDVITYAGRQQKLSLRMDNAGDDGAIGENDYIGPGNEAIIGGDNDDLIVGDNNANSLLGGGGKDVIYGLGGNDYMAGENGDDLLDGGTGADSFSGGGGNDTARFSDRTRQLRITLDDAANDGEIGEGDNVQASMETILGGRGNDNINLYFGVPNANRNVQGRDGNDTIRGGTGHDTIDGGNGDDLLQSSGGNDQFAGGAGTDTADYTAYATVAVHVSLDGVANDGAGAEQDNVLRDVENVYGTNGNDLIEGQSDDVANVFYGQAGNDTLKGGPGNDTLNGGAHHDKLYGDAGHDALNGAQGNDFFSGGNGRDTLNGGADADTFSGGLDADTVAYGGLINLNLSADNIANDGAPNEGDNIQIDVETLIGGAGNDVIRGSAGHNVLRGSFGNDTLIGEGGHDTLDGGQGADVFEGGAGTDTADYSDRTAPLTIGIGTQPDDGEANEHDNIKTDVENVRGGSGNDTISGSSFANEIWGGGGADKLVGREGDDTLHGDNGVDSLEGNQGNDILDGGKHADQLNGGEGRDNAWYGNRTNNVFVKLGDGANDGEVGENDFIQGSVENATAGAGNDTLIGDGQNNRFDGLAGNDTMHGMGGIDTMNGYAGNDRFYAKGDNAVDLIDGGAGTDIAQTDNNENLNAIETLIP
ncbi:MAG: hypothetical protein H7Z14_17285 [Anaerolineae bacterium]|nr:hypothetical protein [Phycisphaerae bacterium]